MARNYWGGDDVGTFGMRAAPEDAASTAADANPSSGAAPDNQSYLQEEQSLNIPDYYQNQTEMQTYVQNEMDLSSMTGGTIGQISLPQGTGWGDFFNLASAADSFAASAGQQYMPNPAQMNQLLKMGASSWDSQQVFQWLASNEGISQKMPWAAAGMTHTQYDSQAAGIQDTIAQYTGDPSMYNELVSEALQKFGNTGEASNWVRTQLTTNKQYTQNAKTPWLQFGMTFQSWNDYKHQNKHQAASRYNATGNVTDAQYAQMYSEGTYTRSADTGTAFGGLQQSQGPLVASAGAGRSSVR